MKFRSVLAAALMLSTSSAFAQDASWTGPYIGAHVGYGWGDTTTTQDVADWGNDPKWIGPFPYDLDGAFGGLTAGYNVQIGQIVVGPEAEVGFMDISGSRTSESSNPIYHQDHEVDGGMYALLGGRAGVAWDRALIYVKGGYVWIDGEQSMATTKPGYRTVTSDNLEGWAYGGGVEYALGGGWALKAEYLRLNLDDLDAAQVSVTDAPIGHVYENHTDLDDIDTFKIGVTYRFGS
jgi:outer membrane immunogenic protein